jgi:2-polyprenyl-6-methoxyphenol hydroxylase-like FAD-dependent oxidoreductase
MSQHRAVDVLICGAGASGLVLAIELARRGIRFRLIEKQASPFRGSRGKGIQPRTLEIFDDLGVVNRMAAAGGPYPWQRLHADDGSFRDAPMVEGAAPNDAEPYRAPLMLPQFLTEGILRDQLATLGGFVEYDHTLTAFTSDASGIEAHVTGPHGDATVHARYLIAADGGRSTIRRALNVGFEGKDLETRAMVADVALSGLDRDAWHRFGHGDMNRQIAICPLAGTDLFQIQAPIPLDAEPDLSTQGIDAFVKQRTGRNNLAVHEVQWASAYHMSARLADQYRVGNVFLVGDAAHVHPPTGGQGLNTSAQDAYNLGWKLAAAVKGADPTLLDTYEEERRPVASDMLGLSTRMLDALKQGSLRRTREASQLDVGYPGVSLAMDARSSSDAVLVAGDRAPDGIVMGAAGKALRLFDLFRGPHWTLLRYGADAPVVGPRAGLRIHTVGIASELQDVHGHLRDSYGLQPGDCVLVRPDGYVGAIAQTPHLRALEQYMDRVGLKAAASPGGFTSPKPAFC